MLIKYVLLATLWQSEGVVQSVEGFDLTGQECIARLEQITREGHARHGIHEYAILSCEIDDSQ